MMLFMILPGVFFILLMVFFLKLKISPRPISSPMPQLIQGVHNLPEMSQRKRGIICKARGIKFKPTFKNKRMATKIVYLTYIEDSRAVVFFDNLYKTFERDISRVGSRRLFEMCVPDEQRKHYINPPLHCNGLFVLPTRIDTILVCNPARKEVITLPESSNRHVARFGMKETVGANIRVGFGFVRSTEAYKVTRFFYRSCNMNEESYSMGFEVFTIGVSSTWRVLGDDPPYPILSSCRMATGNCIYFRIWYSMDRKAPKAFLCFNLRNEKFTTLFPPFSVRHIYIGRMMLSKLQGNLCLSLINITDQFCVFTYKGGTGYEWEPRFCFSVEQWNCRIEPIAEHEGSLLTRVTDYNSQRLKYYDSKDGSFDDVNDTVVDVNMEEEGCSVFKGKPWFAVSSYVESSYQLNLSV